MKRRPFESVYDKRQWSVAEKLCWERMGTLRKYHSDSLTVLYTRYISSLQHHLRGSRRPDAVEVRNIRFGVGITQTLRAMSGGLMCESHIP